MLCDYHACEDTQQKTPKEAEDDRHEDAPNDHLGSGGCGGYTGGGMSSSISLVGESRFVAGISSSISLHSINYELALAIVVACISYVQDSISQLS